ncbi:MAG: Crp/Fnr family transcriptional regulator [Myxococcales bacterium]|nr:MAG: Crp/Fnr family transcriptional regulator [Myxococcales bacterium]
MQQQLDEVERKRLFESYGREHRAGESIFHEGDASDLCYLLQEGRVRLAKQIRGIERGMSVLRPGELFGEDALVSKGVRANSAIALSDVTTLAFDRETFGMLLSNNPDVGFRLLEQLVHRLRDAEERLENSMLRDHPSRVINTLLKLAGASKSKASPLTLDLSPLELSGRAGLDVDAVKAVVLQLREGGYIKIQQEQLVIMDVDALKRLYELLGVKEEVRGDRE